MLNILLPVFRRRHCVPPFIPIDYSPCRCRTRDLLTYFVRLSGRDRTLPFHLYVSILVFISINVNGDRVQILATYDSSYAGAQTQVPTNA